MRVFISTTLFALGSVFSLPSIAHAANTSFFQIVPAACSSCPCGYVAVMETVRNMMNLGVAFAALIFTLMVVWAAFLYLTSPSNPENRRKGNGILIGAAIGLVVVLSSWLIIDLVMRSLYSGPDGNGGVYGPWNTILASGGSYCVEAKDQSPLFSTTDLFSIPSTSGSGGFNTQATSTGTGSTIVGNEAGVRSQLAAAGISINKNPCPSNVSYQQVSGGCTSVGGLRSATVSQIIAIKNICGGITVTGGSELGHADGGISHTTGYKVDLSTGADSCITGGSGGYFTRSGSRGSDPRYYDSCRNEYVRESTHWDITVNAACPR